MEYTEYKFKIIERINEGFDEASHKYIQEMAEITSDFLNSGGKSKEVIDLIEEDLNLNGIDIPDSLRDIDYDRAFEKEYKVRFYFWSSKEAENSQLANRGIFKMKKIMKGGEYDREFLRRCKEDISQLDEIMFPNKEKLIDNLEEIEYELSHAKSDIAKKILK